MSDYQPNRWYAIKDQSLAAYARNAGFDLTVYSQYSRSSRAELRRCAIAEAVKAIALKCEEQGFGIDDIAHGVYVIALSDPLSILYPKHRSQVIYIGMGNIRYRLESHFKRTLFKLMLDLAGTNFDLYLAHPHRPYARQYYKHVEYLMLRRFKERYGSYPMLNKYAGANKNLKDKTRWWQMPLRLSKSKAIKWELTATEFSKYAPLDNAS